MPAKKPLPTERLKVRLKKDDQVKVIAGRDRDKNITLIRDLCETLTDGSLCALGGLTPLPVISALDHFPEDFQPRAPARAAE